MRGSGLRAVQLADQLYGNARQEYDLTERFFPYGNGFLEYNAIQRLSVRGIPEAGVGYKLWKAEEKDSTDFVAGTVGGSWVYERYFGGLDRDYVAMVLGLQAHQLQLLDDADRAVGAALSGERRAAWRAERAVRCGPRPPAQRRCGCVAPVATCRATRPSLRIARVIRDRRHCASPARRMRCSSVGCA